MTQISKAEYDASLAAAYALGRSEATAAAAPGTYATPRVRGLARTLGVDLTKVQGSGVAGRITPSDVRAAAPRAPQPLARDDAYPSHWDTSPVDANDTTAKPSAKSPAHGAGNGAGTAYPAHWKR